MSEIFKKLKRVKLHAVFLSSTLFVFLSVFNPPLDVSALYTVIFDTGRERADIGSQLDAYEEDFANIIGDEASCAGNFTSHGNGTCAFALGGFLANETTHCEALVKCDACNCPPAWYETSPQGLRYLSNIHREAGYFPTGTYWTDDTYCLPREPPTPGEKWGYGSDGQDVVGDWFILIALLVTILLPSWILQARAPTSGFEYMIACYDYPRSQDWCSRMSVLCLDGIFTIVAIGFLESRLTGRFSCRRRLWVELPKHESVDPVLLYPAVWGTLLSKNIATMFKAIFFLIQPLTEMVTVWGLYKRGFVQTYGYCSNEQVTVRSLPNMLFRIPYLYLTWLVATFGFVLGMTFIGWVYSGSDYGDSTGFKIFMGFYYTNSALLLLALIFRIIMRACFDDYWARNLEDTDSTRFSLESPVIEKLPNLPDMTPPNTDWTFASLVGYHKIIKLWRAWKLYYQRGGFIFSYGDEMNLTNGTKVYFLHFAGADHDFKQARGPLAVKHELA